MEIALAFFALGAIVAVLIFAISRDRQVEFDLKLFGSVLHFETKDRRRKP